jgi:hypothetical protein
LQRTTSAHPGSFVLTKCCPGRYEARMWIAISIVGGLIGLVLVMAVIGLMLPRAHVVARRATLAKPPAEVWRALVEVEAHPAWRRGVKRIEVLEPARFREHSAHGAILFEVTESREPALRITRIADDKLPFGGRWIYELSPDGEGTRLAITEDGFVKQPVFRFLARTVFSQSATIEKFLADLGTHLGVPAHVEPSSPSSLAR